MFSLSLSLSLSLSFSFSFSLYRGFSSAAATERRAGGGRVGSGRESGRREEIGKEGENRFSGVAGVQEHGKSRESRHLAEGGASKSMMDGRSASASERSARGENQICVRARFFFPLALFSFFWRRGSVRWGVARPASAWVGNGAVRVLGECGSALCCGECHVRHGARTFLGSSNARTRSLLSRLLWSARSI